MRLFIKFSVNILLCVIFIQGCDDLLNDYQSNEVDPIALDSDICGIMNDLESVTAFTFSSDSLSMSDIFDSLVTDTGSFISLSNAYNWRIPVDSMCYFMVFAPQAADSYVVALNSSSELGLYGSDGNPVTPANAAPSLKNIAGCSDVRVRQAYSGLSGAYLGKLVNPNVTSLKMVIMNTNEPPAADFTTSSATLSIGDTTTFTDQSQNGDYPVITYNWDFGDDNTNDDSSVVQHAYSDSGLFSPSLTVSDGYLFHTITKTEMISVSGGGGE